VRAELAREAAAHGAAEARDLRGAAHTALPAQTKKPAKAT
jgi:hypothetical protein